LEIIGHAVWRWYQSSVNISVYRKVGNGDLIEFFLNVIGKDRGLRMRNMEAEIFYYLILNINEIEKVHGPCIHGFEGR
jgi:hypothetical protein